ARRARASQITVSRPNATMKYRPDHFTPQASPSDTPQPKRHQRNPSRGPYRDSVAQPSSTATASRARTWSRSISRQPNPSSAMNAVTSQPRNRSSGIGGVSSRARTTSVSDGSRPARGTTTSGARTVATSPDRTVSQLPGISGLEEVPAVDQPAGQLGHIP